MLWGMYEPRSDDCYGELDWDSDQTSLKWSDVLLFPIFVILLPLILILIEIFPVLIIGWSLLSSVYSTIEARIKDGKLFARLLAGIGIPLAVILALVLLPGCMATPTPSPEPPFTSTHTPTSSSAPLPLPTYTPTQSPTPSIPPNR